MGTGPRTTTGERARSIESWPAGTGAMRATRGCRRRRGSRSCGRRGMAPRERAAPAADEEAREPVPGDVTGGGRAGTSSVTSLWTAAASSLKRSSGSKTPLSSGLGGGPVGQLQFHGASHVFARSAPSPGTAASSSCSACRSCRRSRRASLSTASETAVREELRELAASEVVAAGAPGCGGTSRRTGGLLPLPAA